MKMAVMLVLLLGSTSSVDGVVVSSEIPKMQITRVHVDKVEHDETTNINYSDYHLFVTIKNKTDDEVEELWAKVCYKVAKDPTCENIEIGGDFKPSTESESYPVPYRVAQQPTEIDLVKIGTTRSSLEPLKPSSKVDNK